MPKLSVMLYASGGIEDLDSLANIAINNGINDFYFADHLIGGAETNADIKDPWLAMTPTLMYFANKYRDINVGTLVASPSLRPSALLCLEAATIAHLIGEKRFSLTIGSGGAKSDQDILGENLNPQALSMRLDNYVENLVSRKNKAAKIPLRLASDFTLRIASDSFSTIDLVERYANGWVTTGGWKKGLDSRVSTINTLWQHLKSKGFKAPVSLLCDINDGVDLFSSREQVQDYLAKYDVPISELIIPITINKYL